MLGIWICERCVPSRRTHTIIILIFPTPEYLLNSRSVVPTHMNQLMGMLYPPRNIYIYIYMQELQILQVIAYAAGAYELEVEMLREYRVAWSTKACNQPDEALLAVSVASIVVLCDWS